MYFPRKIYRRLDLNFSEKTEKYFYISILNEKILGKINQVNGLF